MVVLQRDIDFFMVAELLGKKKCTLLCLKKFPANELASYSLLRILQVLIYVNLVTFQRTNMNVCFLTPTKRL